MSETITKKITKKIGKISEKAGHIINGASGFVEQGEGFLCWATLLMHGIIAQTSLPTFSNRWVCGEDCQIDRGECLMHILRGVDEEAKDE